MSFYKLPEFKELEKFLNYYSQKGINVLLVTMAGFSLSYFVKKYWEKNRQKNLGYLTAPGAKVQKYNLLDLRFEINPKGVELAEEYLRQAATGEKFAVLASTPYLFEPENFKASYLGTHTYARYEFKRPSLKYLLNYAKEMGIKLTDFEITKLDEFSGRMGRLVKFLLMDKQKLNQDADDLAQNVEVQTLLSPVVETVSKCSESDLEKYGVKEKGKWTSRIVEELMAKKGVRNFSLEVMPDLSLKETGDMGSRLTKVEANILKFMLTNDGLVTKEQVATLKWGEDSYDEFSDQAIGKTMRRLSGKMKIYAIRTIPKYGFTLIVRGYE